MPKGKNTKTSPKSKTNAKVLKDTDVQKVRGGAINAYLYFDAASPKKG